MPLLNEDTISIHYEQTGEGPDVVWVCGGGGLPEWTWCRWQIPAFPRYRHTVFHNRGIGETTCNQPGPWTIADFAADTALVIERTCAGPAIVVGKSMGAMITTQLALDRPELVALAISMGTAGKSYGWIHDYMRAEIEFRKRGGSLSGLFAVCHYAATLNPADELGDPDSWNALKDQYAPFGAVGDNPNERSLELQWDACDTFDCLDQLPTCTVPLHVVGFGQDVQSPPRYGQEVAELAPTGVFHLLPGHGHASLWGPMRSGEVNDLLREIFSGHDG
jgi:pimeloyl-ACP methyl ester carboxylesterase